MAEEKKESELAKARGETEAQQEQKAYHEGDFQTTDPVTGEPRGKTMNWQDEDNPNPPIGEELTPDQLKAQEETERARSAESGATPAEKPPARKTARKRGR